MGSSGVNSTPSFYGHLLIETLGFKLKIVVGYHSQSRVFLAMERGRGRWLSERLLQRADGDAAELGHGKEGQAPGADRPREETNLPDVPVALDLPPTRTTRP